MKNIRSIRNKLLIVIQLISLCTLIIVGVLILLYDIKSFRENRINDITTQAELLAYSSVPALKFGNKTTAEEHLNLLHLRTLIRAAAIYDSRGNFFAGYVRTDEPHVFPRLPGEEAIKINNGNMVVFKRVIENDEILGSAYISADYPLRERIFSFAGIFTFVALGALLISILASIRFQSVITRPILSVVDIARKVVTDEDYTQRAEKISEDEVGILVDAFNEMLDEITEQKNALISSNFKLEQEIAERKRAREEILILNEELERKVIDRTNQLKYINQELESFCYSVSHDLRAPLRSINGFAQALKEDMPSDLPEEVHWYLDRITSASVRMGQLIDDLLNLSQVSRIDLVRENFDFSNLTNNIVSELNNHHPNYHIETSVWGGIKANGDPKLLRIVMENLLNNAWKFTSKCERPRVEIGSIIDGKREVYFVRDNGTGFDMAYVDKLFSAFQRLHRMDEFEGNGIGLATVQRIIHRHGGHIWANSSPGNGAVFYFTLKPASGNLNDVVNKVDAGNSKMINKHLKSA